MTEAGVTTRCRQCHKPIVWPGLCYTCATGLPRQVRPRENTAADHNSGPRAQTNRVGPARRMPRHYIDEEWDRDALFTCRNLVSIEFAAELMKVSTHTLEKNAGRAQGPLLMWVFGGRGQLMRKYLDVYVDMGPSPGPELPHAWQGHSAEELLGEAPERHASPSGLDGLQHAAN